MKLIVGLGNPGRDYAGTRHNVGFDVVDVLAERHHIPIAKRDFKSQFGDGFIGAERVLLVKPQTFMNLSGEAVAGLARFYKVSPEDIWVVSDDVALPVGKLRLRMKGSAGGHNGLANIATVLGTQEFARVRIGVGASRPGNLVGHVLSRFRKEEAEIMEDAYAAAADAIETALKSGFETAMNLYNVRPKPPADAG